jgi:hypothetical protein
MHHAAASASQPVMQCVMQPVMQGVMQPVIYGVICRDFSA